MLQAELIEKLANYELDSPQPLDNSLYFRMRITGTGDIWRSTTGEIYRPPEKYFTPEFLSVVSALPIIVYHPDDRGTMHPFQTLQVGNTVKAYIHPEHPDEIWGIGRIIDGYTQHELLTRIMSTSPSVVAKPSYEEDGRQVEGDPILIDHLAICDQGVWDKGGPPSGIDQILLPSAITNDNSDEEVGMRPEELQRLIAQSVRDSLKPINDRLEKIETSHLLGLNDSESQSKATEHQEELPEEKKAEKEAKELPVNKDSNKGKAVHKDDDEEMKDDDEEDDEEDEEEDMENKSAPVISDKKVHKDSNKGKKVHKDDDAKPNPDTDEKDEHMQNSKIAELEKQLAELKSKLETSDDDDDEEMVDDEEEGKALAQEHADAIYQRVGKRTPRPMARESLLAYRKRLVAGLQEYSKQFKDTKLVGLNDSVLAVVEKQVFNDAVSAAKVNAIGSKKLRSTTVNKGGHTIVEWHGPSNVMLDMFSLNGRTAKFRSDVKRA